MEEVTENQDLKNESTSAQRAVLMLRVGEAPLQEGKS